MTENDDLPSLEALGEKVQQVRQKTDKPKPDPKAPRAMMGQAMRIAIDQVSAILVGFGIGYVLDEVLGTRPILMIVFILFGFAAGIQNVYRNAMRMGQSADKVPKETAAQKGGEPNKE